MIVFIVGSLLVYGSFKLIFKDYNNLKKRFKELNESYTIHQYATLCLIISMGLLFFCSVCLTNYFYTFILIIITIAILPVVLWLRKKQKYDQLLYQELLLYVTSGILFIQERKSSLKILKECAELVKGPLHLVLNEAISTIENTTDFEKGLTIIEKRFDEPCIKKLHVLLRSINEEGSYHQDLYQYLYQSTETLEMNLNEYQLSKENNHHIFYGMWLLNFMAIMCLINLFQIEVNQINSESFNILGSLFYLINLASLLYYELWCSKKVVLQ